MTCSWQRVDTDLSLHRDGQHRVDKQVLRTLATVVNKMGDHEVHQALRFGAGDRRQDDQAGMKLDAGSQLPEIVGVLGDDNPVFLDGMGKDDVIGISQPAAITRMDRVVMTLIEMLAQRRRNAFVDEKPHAFDPRRRSAGRPTCG